MHSRDAEQTAISSFDSPPNPVVQPTPRRTWTPAPPTSSAEHAAEVGKLRREIREIKQRMRTQWSDANDEIQDRVSEGFNWSNPLSEEKEVHLVEDERLESDSDDDTSPPLSSSGGDPPSVMPPGPPEPPNDGGSGLEVTELIRGAPFRSGSKSEWFSLDGRRSSLVGALFPDAFLGWCVVTMLGARSGIPIAGYAGIGSFPKLTLPGYFTLESDILSWLRIVAYNASLFPALMLGVQDGYLSESPLPADEEVMFAALANATDKYEAANIIQPPNDPESLASSVSDFQACPSVSGRGRPLRPMLLSPKQMRRVLAARETLFKFGNLVPRNDREANASPEAHRWKAGRDLEWLRLNEQGTFEMDWDLARVRREHPDYKKSDIGHCFYVYDYKFSGEHRVRLVFDGSRQSPDTYSETYAPTARQESVRLFHVVAVEESYDIGQYDVPQAFLKAFMDHVIFAYPPKGQAAYDGQLLKVKRALYGGKQSAFLWFQMVNEYLLELGFVASPLDSCFYRRHDAILILFCDDMRIGASTSVLQSLHQSLFAKFGVTTASGTRFLGMDTYYDKANGLLKISMETYIDSTVARFENFDLSAGVPFRELVGCLLWVTLCVMGPELLRVKDLARLCNSYTPDDYAKALKVLARVSVRKFQGLVFRRESAGRELIPSSTRVLSSSSAVCSPDDPDLGLPIPHDQNELREKLLCKTSSSDDSSYTVPDPDALDIVRVHLPVNSRYSLTVYGDASFAIGLLKQSISGYVIYLNGTPILWGSLKQTIVVDSSCSAEFVAASVAVKQLLHAENMIGFLGFTCAKPYRMYTDSMACLHIATNPARLGNVRHLQIRYHLVRCYVSLGDVELKFCVTEEMVADLFTKLVAGGQDERLTVRFYCLIPGSDTFVLTNDFQLGHSLSLRLG